MKCKSPQGGCIRGEVEEECTSSFLVGDLQITTQYVGLFMDKYIYIGLYPKDNYKSKLQSPREPHMEEESKTTPFGCEVEILVEEQATIVSVQEEDKVKNMCDEGSYFCSSNFHLHPSDQWKDKNSPLASQDCKRKANCERDKFTPRFSVGDHKISAKKGEVIKGDNMVK